jgi:hypothetical protein
MNAAVAEHGQVSSNAPAIMTSATRSFCVMMLFICRLHRNQHCFREETFYSPAAAGLANVKSMLPA